MASEYLTRVLLNMADEAVFRGRSVVPGKVREVTGQNNGERVVTFEPGIGRREGGEEVADGPVTGVPVLYPSGGGWSDVWPVDAGDELLGLAADRNTERWKANREPGQAHSLHRSHDLSDTLALPYAITPANAPDPGTDRVISNERGEVMRLGLGELTISTPGPNPLTVATLELTAGGNIELTVAAGSKVIAGDALASALTKVNQLLAALNTASAAAILAADTISPPAGTSAGSVAFTAFIASLNAILVALAGTTKLEGT